MRKIYVIFIEVACIKGKELLQGNEKTYNFKSQNICVQIVYLASVYFYHWSKNWQK